jgi:hypothetical protein
VIGTSNTDTQDDLYQLHIHKFNDVAIPENPKGPHVLNVYRAPGFDDADLVVLPVQGELNGIWDDGDFNDAYDAGDQSEKLSDNLQNLCESKIFAAGHGDGLDSDDPHPHHAPYIKMLLEPTKDGQKICKKLGY